MSVADWFSAYGVQVILLVSGLILGLIAVTR
ncbi:hypothetical protein EKPJFOCH_4321 [Methylobacterium thuringiense]|uniref:Uncharacterized protein n=1 Tax=Methylobacterium thuringiense TaxID=1003091 RepID=A0ABQ4TT59_9HYPH|nr:hypothetical protein EKPJFOCH_4321 [Methylobacterium thuringiense]